MKTFLITRILSATLMMGIFLINFSVSSCEKEYYSAEKKEPENALITVSEKKLNPYRKTIPFFHSYNTPPLLPKQEGIIHTELDQSFLLFY